MFGGNDQAATPASAPIQTATSDTTQATTATTGTDTQKLAGQLEANTAKPGELATPSETTDENTNKSLLGR
jgi:hypothetical protein